MTFIKSVCTETITADKDIIFGRLSFNPDLLLLLYGISHNNQLSNFQWHVISRKVMGMVMLLNWEDQTSVTSAKKIIEYFTSRYNFPIVIAADLNNHPVGIHRQIVNSVMALTLRVKFVFYQNAKVQDIKNVMATLLNTIIGIHP